MIRVLHSCAEGGEQRRQGFWFAVGQHQREVGSRVGREHFEPGGSETTEFRQMDLTIRPESSAQQALD